MTPRASPDPAKPEGGDAAGGDAAEGTDGGDGAEGGGNDDDQMSAAALKIQTRQRGVRDRKRVEEEKNEGTLPGQQRAAIEIPEGGDAAGGDADCGTDGGDDTAGVGNDDDQMTAAALKIQTRQRGVRDRKRVEGEKLEGNLPGQRRAVISKPVYRESEKGKGEIAFYDGIGSKYSGELLNGRPHGKGQYTFVNGNIYEGDFVNGQFHGDGQMVFPGYGKFVSKYENGRAIGGQFLFEDGLEYQPQSWPYCVEGDRRFYHEVVNPRFGLTD